MKRIDQFFKENLSTRGLEYNDAHWAGMEELLDQNKKAFWFSNRMLVAGFILLIGLSAASIWWWNYNDGLNQNDLNIATSQPSNLDIPKAEIPVIIDSFKTNNFTLNLDLIDFPVSNYLFLEGPSCAGVIYSNDYSIYDPNTYLPIYLTNTTSATFDIHIPSSKLIELRPEVTAPKYSPLLSLPPSKKRQIFAGIHSKSIDYQKLLSSKLQEQTAAQQSVRTTNFGLDIRLKHRNWSLLTGVGQTTLQEKTNFETSTTTWTYNTKYTLLVDQYTETPRGTKVSLIKKETDSIPTTTTSINCPNCKANFSYIDLPLEIQYEIKQNRISAFSRIGLTASILQNASGLYGVSLQDNGVDNTELLVLPLEQNKAYLAPILWQTQATLGFNYYINNRWNAWASYGISQSLNSMLIDLDQKTKNQQLGLGIEFRIEKK